MMHTIARLNYSLFILAYLVLDALGLSIPERNTNITVSAPDGTSNHGQPNLLCTPLSWFDIFIFFAANYGAHAATVKTWPGERTVEVAFTVFLAIFFPFSGIPRGLGAILRHASWYFGKSDYPKHGLQTAARAGALCVVIRTSRWKLSENSEVQGMKFFQGVADERIDLPRLFVEGFRTRTIKPFDPFATLSKENHSHHSVKTVFHLVKSQFRLLPAGRDVHGLRCLPPGYTIAELPPNIMVESNLSSGAKLDIPSSSNIAQILVALVQTMYASVTLYKSRGTQITQFGYAAFGLTVLPYILMSVVNLLGNLVTPNYPALYLVSSPELREAISRGAQVEGIVGKVIPENWKDSELTFKGKYRDTSRGRGYPFHGQWTIQRIRRTNDIPTNYNFETGLPNQQGNPSMAHGIEIETERLSSDSNYELSQPDKENLTSDYIVTRSKFQKDLDRANPVVHFPSDALGPANPPWPPREVLQSNTQDVVSEDNSEVETLKLKFRNPSSLESTPQADIVIQIPAASNFKAMPRSFHQRKDAWWYLIGFIFFFIGAIPYAVIGSMTHFHAGESTRIQQIFTMFWLASGIFLGTVMNTYQMSFTKLFRLVTHPVNLSYEVRRRWQVFESFGATLAKKFNIIWVFLRVPVLFFVTLCFIVAGIGGFVVVGQMLRMYGNCTVL